MQLNGIGPVTATSLTTSIGNGRAFKNGRQLEAWPGLVPDRDGSGGKTRLGRITNAGGRYLQTFLIMGARSLLLLAPTGTNALSRWALTLAAGNRERKSDK